jgi:polysaccharide deacetylase family protein (PEP-CTERM system associated)
MLNALTVDVEDYFQVEAFAHHIPFHAWDSYEPRVERNVFHILELFAKNGVTATFFVLGWVAEKFPRLGKEIASAGHEIGCHSYAHRRLHHMTSEEFRADLRLAASLVCDQVGQPIRCFRAPSFSIVRETMWAFEILGEEGFLIDSSIFPVRHDFYGIPDANRFPHREQARTNKSVFEFPPSTIRVGNRNYGVAGGGYLRLMSYGMTHWAIRRINEVEGHAALVYFHPWEIDPAQPVIRSGFRSTIRHYTNLFTTEGKIERLLQEFKFTTLTKASMQYQDDLTAVSQRVTLPEHRQAAAAAGDNSTFRR